METDEVNETRGSGGPAKQPQSDVRVDDTRRSRNRSLAPARRTRRLLSVSSRGHSCASQRSRSRLRQEDRSPGDRRSRSRRALMDRSPDDQRSRSRSPRPQRYSPDNRRSSSRRPRRDYSPGNQRSGSRRPQRDDSPAESLKRSPCGQRLRSSLHRRRRSQSRLDQRGSTDDVTLFQLVQALTAVSNRSVNDKLSYQNTIPEFNPANKEQTIDIWLHKVNECATIYNWTDNQTIHFALTKLKGYAQKWYEGLTSVMYSWLEWQEKLRLAFPCDENYGQLLTVMLGKRARFNDSLEEYYYDKVVLLNRCGIQGKKAVDCIIFGIEDRSVRLGAEAARFSTPEQLLPFLKSARSTVNHFSTVSRRNRTNDSKIDRNFTTRDSRELNSKSSIQCYNCLDYGHYKSQCTKPTLKCTKCSRFGHVAEKCNSKGTTSDKNADSTKTVMMVTSNTDSSITKYYKQAIVNGVTKTCFIDFGSFATLIRNSELVDLGIAWEPDVSLPTLRGFGDSMVRPLGKCSVDITIDNVTARVDVFVVPDHLLREPLLIGRSFTEQPHIMIEKDSVSLRIRTNNIAKITLFCVSDTKIDGLTLVDFKTEPNYTGDVYIEGSHRYKIGQEHFLIQGLFSVVEGAGVALLKGLSSQPFVLSRGCIIARCCQADPSTEAEEVGEILRIETAEPQQPILKVDVKTDNSLDSLTVESLVSLLNRFRNCFAFNLQELGKTSLVEMSINLKDDEPVVYRPYRLPVSERCKVREMVEELIDCDIVRPSTSPYASPIVIVKKKTGDVRLCVDYRALNRKTFRENYPLPRIDDQLDDLAGYEYYTTLDLASGYYQIAIKEDDRYKTSFVTPDGQFEFNRMPFGLANAPANFMRMINLVLCKARGIASAYMDDIVIPSRTAEEGLERLGRVLQLLQDAGLTLKLSKCCFFSKTVDYLGFELSKKGIRPGSRKIEAVRDFPEPSNQHGVRQFIGLCSFFRRFVRNFSIIAKPLTCLLKKDAKWCWGSGQIESFKALKDELLRKPILALYDPKAQTELHTDACKIGIAGILMQRNKDNILRPVAYYSRQTTPDEQHMTSYELETLALVASLQKFRVYLIGIEFKVFTDCNSLRATFLKRDLIPRVARWWISMQEFNFSIEYRPGKSMAYVDALSRNPPLSNESGSDTNAVEIMVVTETDWLCTVQQSDTEIQRKISILQDSESANVVDIKKNFVVRNNKLYRITEGGEKWVVPKGVRWQILKQCHDDIGHFAFDKTLAKVKESYWFGKMRRFVKKYVDSCLECAYTKSSTKRKVPLHPIPKVDSPFATIHIDHVGPFVKSSKGNTYLLVIIDAYTKFIMLKPVRSTKASIVIEKLREYFSIFGVPKRIVSDRGSSFTSKKFKDFLSGISVKHILNAVATPRANGQVERYNRTVLDALTAKCAGRDERKWDYCIPDVQWGLNNTHNKGIGRTPSEVLFGTSLIGLNESRVKIALNQDHDVSTDTLNKIRERVNEYITNYQTKQKAQYDKNTVEPKMYQVGDLVCIEREVPSLGHSRKLVPKYQGPYRVTSMLGNDRYQVEDTPITRKRGRKYSSVVAVDKMKPWLSFSRSDDAKDSSDSDGDTESIDCE